MEENENESGEPENDNSKKVEITDQDFKNYMRCKFEKTEIPVKTTEDQDITAYLDKKFPK